MPETPESREEKLQRELLAIEHAFKKAASLPEISAASDAASGSFGPGTSISAGGGKIHTVKLLEEAKTQGVSKGRFKVRDSALPVRTTQPKEIKRHNISDEELEMLERTNRDGLSEAFWGMVGIAAGTVAPALESLWAAFLSSTPVPISPLHLIEIALLIGAICAGAAIRIIDVKRSGNTRDIIARIRRRRAA